MSWCCMFLYTPFKCLIIFVAYLCVWFHLSCFKLSVRCCSPLQPCNQMNAGTCFSDGRAKPAAILTLEFTGEALCLLKASAGGGGAELSSKYTVALGSSEGGELVAPQSILAVLHRPAELEHGCARHAGHQWAKPPLKAHQLRQNLEENSIIFIFERWRSLAAYKKLETELIIKCRYPGSFIQFC